MSDSVRDDVLEDVATMVAKRLATALAVMVVAAGDEGVHPQCVYRHMNSIFPLSPQVFDAAVLALLRIEYIAVKGDRLIVNREGIARAVAN